ncbi:MAG TPA: DUF5916 domain-containing protein [Thermoanaerobaculia bacterium]|nr:DUF5916 domain-containing protein [Thermoanaerobaculia bacterium]
MKRLFVLALLLSTSVFAQTREIALPRASTPVTMDGDLSDEAWKTAAIIDTFYEYQRSDSGTPPVPTTAYVTYDDHYFYVGIDCRDPEPAKIRAPYVDRDHVFGDADNVAVLIDARGEGKVALQLRANPRGIQGDAVNNDSAGSEDFSPDFFYDTAAKITATGWVVEMRVPMSTLRYADADPKTWGLIILRNWPRETRYTVSSSPLPRGSNCFICHEIKLTGITSLPSSQHLTVAPYIRAEQSAEARILGEPLDHSSFNGDGGVDVKWSPTPDTAIDATINPDFSQIEADVAQISTNQRFALFFAEKRPFFLEGSDLLETPIQAVYTRTITSPRWGARATGKNGANTWTFLVSDDRGGGLLILPGPLESGLALQNEESIAAIGRVRREIGRSAVGMLVTAREVDGDGGHNRVIGPDFEWRPNDTDQVAGQLLISDTDDARINATSHALRLNWTHNKREHDWYAGFKDYGDDFRADNGFVPQVGFREVTAGAGWNRFPENSSWTQFRWYVNAQLTNDRDDNKILQDANVGFLTRGTRNLLLILEPHQQDVRTGNGTLLDQTFLFYGLTMYPSAWFPNLSITGEAGERIDFANSRRGRGFNTNITAIFRPAARLQTEVTFNHEQLDVRDTPDNGRLFSANVERIKATYSFTAKSLLRVIGQYLDVESEPGRYLFPVDRHSGSFTGSLLYSYKINWQTLLFVGYGDDRTLDANADLLRENRTFFVKVSYALQR